MLFRARERDRLSDLRERRWPDPDALVSSGWDMIVWVGVS